MGVISINLEVTDQILIIHYTFVRYLRKKWEYYGTVYEIFIDFKKAFDLIMRGVLCNILIEIAVSMKLGRLTRFCLNETF